MPAPTIADVRRMLQARGRIEGLHVEWSARPRRVTYPTGLVGWRGEIDAQAPGYRARRMIVTRDASGTAVR